MVPAGNLIRKRPLVRPPTGSARHTGPAATARTWHR